MLKVTFASLLTLILAAPAAWAQQGRSTPGMFGNRTLGGASNFSNNRGMNSGLGGGGLGGLGMGGMSGSQSGGSNLLQGNERFLRSSRAPGQFVGADSRDSSFVGAMTGANTSAMGGMGGMGTMGMMGGRGMSGLGGLGMGGGSSYLGMGGLGGFGGMGSTGFLGGVGGLGRGGLGSNSVMRNGMNGRNQRMGMMGRNNMNFNGNGNRTVTRRTTLAVGFSYRPESTALVATRLNDRLRDLQLGGQEAVQVELQDGVATLRGRVASQDERDLARRIAQMEPGVQTVIDQLSVAEPEATATSPSDRP